MGTTNTVSPLRQRMIEDMTARNLGSHSQRSHIHSCRRFAAFLKRSPDTATADDVRLFQLYLIESGLSTSNRNRIMTGVKFLFRVTLRRHDLAAEIYHLKEPQKLPLTMSPDEAERLLATTGSLRDLVMLSLGYGCGLRAGEIVRLRAGDIDSAQMIIRIVQSKGRKDRHVMLPPELLLPLRQWWTVRPTRYDADVPVRERWLFPGHRRGQHLTTRHLSRIFHESAAAAGITKRVSLHSLRHYSESRIMPSIGSLPAEDPLPKGNGSLLLIPLLDIILIGATGCSGSSGADHQDGSTLGVLHEVSSSRGSFPSMPS